MQKAKKFLLLGLLGFCLTLAGCSASTQAKYDPQKALGPQINYTITGIDADRKSTRLNSSHLA